ncbi:MAG: DUF6056 family protein [Gammaproteobacteria bacterium]
MRPASQPPKSLPVRAGAYLLVAACLAVVVVFVLLGQYAHPSSDDFCMAAGVNRYGLFTQLWNHYFEWSGRYSGNALYAVYPMLFGLFDGYRFIPVIMIVSLLLAAAFFLSALFRSGMFARPVLLSSLCFVAVYLLGLLSPASSLYWMAGAMSYQTANILLLVIFGLMIRIARRQRQAQAFSILMALLLIVVIIAMGTSETSMLAITAVVLLAFIIHLRSGWVILRPWLATLIVTLICCAIVYFSPGNAIRAADFPMRHDLARAIIGSLLVSTKVLWIWLSSPVLIVATLLAPFAVVRLSTLSAVPMVATKTQTVLLLVCTFALPMVLQFPAWWAMGGWPPARTLDAVYFLFLLSWFATISAITLRFTTTAESHTESPPIRASMAVAVIVLALLFTAVVLTSHGMHRAKDDLFHTAGPWHDYMNQRYLHIEQAVADRQRYLTVADYPRDYPRSLYFNDIMHNPRHWRNLCYADYFGLKKIKRDQAASSLDRNRYQYSKPLHSNLSEHDYKMTNI